MATDKLFSGDFLNDEEKERAIDLGELLVDNIWTSPIENADYPRVDRRADFPVSIGAGPNRLSLSIPKTSHQMWICCDWAKVARSCYGKRAGTVKFVCFWDLDKDGKIVTFYLARQTISKLCWSKLKDQKPIFRYSLLSQGDRPAPKGDGIPGVKWLHAKEDA